MATLRWMETDAGIVADAFRIHRDDELPGANWRLEMESETGDWTIVSHHRSLRSARFRAESLSVQRIRAHRVRVRIVLGAVALLSAVAMAQAIQGPATFLATVALFGLGVRALAAAVSIRFEHASGWSDGERNRLSVLDRVAATISTRSRARADGPPAPAANPQVRVLPPVARSSDRTR